MARNTEDVLEYVPGFVPTSNNDSWTVRGFANANTLSWLVEFMRPERKNFPIELFFGKIARMATFKESVVPHLAHPEASGLDAAALAARITPPVPRAVGWLAHRRRDALKHSPMEGLVSTKPATPVT